MFLSRSVSLLVFVFDVSFIFVSKNSCPQFDGPGVYVHTTQ
jgi:hypothetical protein